MNEWISVKEKYPDDGQKVIIRIYDRKTNKEIELKAKFRDYEDYRGWVIENQELFQPDEKSPISRPTHWMPLPTPPED